MTSEVNVDNQTHKMKRPDVDVVYDHENRCVWADNSKYVLKRTDVHRELYDMTLEWGDKKLILRVSRGVSKGWHGREHHNKGRSLNYDNGHFENPAHKLTSWDEVEHVFAILFLCLEKFLINFPRNMTGFDIDLHWNKAGFAMYRFEDIVVKKIAADYPRFVWADPE